MKLVTPIKKENFTTINNPLPVGDQYVFDIVIFQSKVYAAVSTPGQLPFIYNITDGAKIYIQNTIAGEYFRGLYNYKNEKFCIASCRPDGGKIYTSIDMVNFTTNLSISSSGFRCIGKPDFSDSVIAGTDDGVGTVYISDDFINWTPIIIGSQQCNNVVMMGGILWLLSNNGVWKTADLINFTQSKSVDPDLPQIYAGCSAPEGLYIATSKATTEPAYSDIYFMPSDCSGWQFKCHINAMPLIYWIEKVKGTDDILLGGTSHTIYQMNFNLDIYWPIYTQNQYAIYTHEIVGSDWYFGTYSSADIFKLEYPQI